jgi:CHAT domain-containing protein
VVTATAVQVVQLPVELVAVQQLMQRLWLNFGTAPRSAPLQLSQLEGNARSLLKELHELLMAPLASQISEYPRLIIVPHGPLHYLPFHALYDGQSYLVQDHEISYLPAGSFLRYCREALRDGAGLIA